MGISFAFLWYIWLIIEVVNVNVCRNNNCQTKEDITLESNTYLEE